MTQLHACVRTGRTAPPATHLTAAVRHDALVAVPLGVAKFAAKAEVFPRHERIDALAARAPPPAGVCPGGLGPLLDAMDVEDLDGSENASIIEATTFFRTDPSLAFEGCGNCNSKHSTKI